MKSMKPMLVAALVVGSLFACNTSLLAQSGGGRGRGALRRRPDALRRVPAVAGRIRTGREGVRRGQPRSGQNQGIHREKTAAGGICRSSIKLI